MTRREREGGYHMTMKVGCQICSVFELDCHYVGTFLKLSLPYTNLRLN